MRRPTSLTQNINPVLREYLFKKEIMLHQKATAAERKNLLQHFFDFLAREYHLPSAMEIVEEDIKALSKETLQHYKKYLQEVLENSEATIFFKLSEIRLFYEDFLTSHPGDAPERDPFEDYPRTRQKKTVKSLKDSKIYLDFFSGIDGPFKTRDRLMFALMLTMGLTDAEICALNLEDILQDGAQIYLKMTGRADTSGSVLVNRIGVPMIQHPCLPVNLPTAILLQNWLTQRKDAMGDALGQPLCMTKYRRRLKPGSLGLIFKNLAEKQKCDPEDFTPKALRKFALQNYQAAGGSAAGLRDYFGCGLFLDSKSDGNTEAFINNPLITALNQCVMNDANSIETFKTADNKAPLKGESKSDSLC